MKDTHKELVPVIIGGSHRSGTTLMRRIINGSNNIYCPPEVKFHKDLLGQYLNDELAFARLGSSIKALGLPLEIWLDEFGKAYKNCLQLAAKSVGKTRWADKNPENSLNIWHWHRLLNGKLKFIMMVRNPLDIISSMEEVNMKRAIPSDLNGKIQHVKLYIETGLDYCDSNSDSSKIIRYEDLVMQSVTTLDQLFEWLGEEWDITSLNRINSNEHAVGIEDPKITNNAQISSLSVDRWKKDLNTDKIAQITELLDDLMIRLGYKLSNT